MAKTLEIVSNTLLCVLLLMSCSARQDCFSNETMIEIAKTSIDLFDSLDISSIQARSDYYICNLKDSSDYLITTDLMLVRDIQNNMEIISSCAKNEVQLPKQLQKLLPTIECLYIHNISYIQVKEDTVVLCRYDGYYLTNIVPPNFKSTLTEVQQGWFSNSNK